MLLTGRHGGGCDAQDLKRVDPKEGRGADNMKGDWPISEKAYTLHMAPKNAGYDTATFGKWGLGEYGRSGAPDKHGYPWPPRSPPNSSTSAPACGTSRRSNFGNFHRIKK